jgi:hypothetical protein
MWKVRIANLTIEDEGSNVRMRCIDIGVGTGIGF